MLDCDHCGKPVPATSSHHEFHEECDVEWHRRIDNKLCILCGGDDPEGSGRCEKCDADSPYLGYENCYTG